MPIINNNSITFYTGDAKNSITVECDYSPTISLQEYWEEHQYQKQNIFGVDVDMIEDLDEVCSVNDKNVIYDRYYYIPYMYLLKVIPYISSSNNDPKNTNIDICKAFIHGIPIYSIDPKNLVLPFDNIPISFMQPLNKILKDIENRVLPVNQLLAQDLMELLTNRKIMCDWDKDMKISSRVEILHSINAIAYKKVRSDYYMKIF